ncbi:MAG: entericidin A/B family lipoprotein [Rhodobacteraceae bacterium]|nr:entericidin A/B family lipoprotein [Paracoccaceae bacterium]
MSRIAVLAAAVTAVLSLGACNTIEGIGKDTKSVGKAIERTAEDAKD